ncbi:TetR/AcrR family transcriptional regulator [Tsuneonella troitsensis]|uniref:TetR/AcrR family transcriptional regulator n=1 Tax=Tsuneonella troitsensis TaxID=292222 RepID=UPI00070C0480|nr:TetR/AcrR family transcriptional regulator [Tsuneonella troitsensis]
MTVAGHSPDNEKGRLVRIAMRLIEERGEEVSRLALANGAGIPRARVEALFPEESDLFDAIVENWFADYVTIMEDVVAADLPPNRKMYEFFARRFLLQRERFRADPAAFKVYCELGAANFERVRSYVDLADHYLCELIAQAQAEGSFEGLAINDALSLINQMVLPYTMADVLTYMDERLSEQKLGRIVDTLFAGLSAQEGGARGLKGLRAA